MIKLRVLADYRCRERAYIPGQIIDFDDDEEARWLLRDAPHAFEVVTERAEVEGREIEAPPLDKMLRKAKTK